MKAKYIGDPREPGGQKNLPDETSMFDLTFPRDKWVDVPEHLEAKFIGNSHFDTRGKPESDEGEAAAKAEQPENPTGAPVNDGTKRVGPRGSGTVSGPAVK